MPCFIRSYSQILEREILSKKVKKKKMKILDILTCITSVFILFLFSFVRTDTTNNAAVKLEPVYRNEGQNVTLKCSNGSLNGSIWIVSDENSKFAGLKPRSPNSAVLKDGSFFISDLSSSDSHLYTCQDVETNKSLRIGKLGIIYEISRYLKFGYDHVF